jgi:Flp pilus assembly pilin Flp
LAFYSLVVNIAAGKGVVAMHISTLKRFLREEQGQDLIEYTLLLAFVCLASATFFIGAGKSVSGIWTAANSRLGAANSAAAS